MGKKRQGAKLRAHKRGKGYGTEIVETRAVEAESQHVVEKSNEELFVIDTDGSSTAVVPPQLKTLPTKKELAKISEHKKSNLALLDQRKVDQLVKQHDPKKLQAMVKAGEAQLRGRRNKNKRFDLWENDAANALAEVGRSKKKHRVSAKQDLIDANTQAFQVQQVGGVRSAHIATIAEQVSQKPKDAVAVDVARAGQSYRPDPEAYKAVVNDAISLEMRRKKAQDHARAPLATGMSPETRALLVGDSDSEESEEEEENDGTDVVAIRKRPDKLTRAERNKQKRLRAEKAIQVKQKETKKLMNSVAEIPRFKKEIKKKERTMEEKRAEIEEKKLLTKPTPGKGVLQRMSDQDPIHAPTLPVALEEEHKDSSLRTIKPKGSLITDRMASYADRKLVGKRKFGDKKRIMQGKKRRIKMHGKGHERELMDHALMG